MDIDPIKSTKSKPLGRTFNHLEDLVFFYGTAGIIEAVTHLRELNTTAGSRSLRMKWDGNPQIYWGRETVNGPLLFTGHNGWQRKVKTTSSDQLEDFIINGSGSAKTQLELAERERFAKQFASLYSLFDQITPKDFTGFVYADGLFLSKPDVVNGVYTFAPNPKSRTQYHVDQDSSTGKRVSQADVMIAGHAVFSEYGAADSAQTPISDFSKFNFVPELMIQEPVYNTAQIQLDETCIKFIELEAMQHCNKIDQFLEDRAGLADLKTIIYRYINYSARAKQLDDIGTAHFFEWLVQSSVSVNKQNKILQLNADDPLSCIFDIVTQIQILKDHAIDQLEQHRGEIWDTNGEGRVRYADDTKQFGNIKLVPRKRWTPA